MASPGAFLSSPSRASRRACPIPISSSPDLPLVQDLLSQKPRLPPLLSGSKAVSIGEDEGSTTTTTTFPRANSLRRTLQANGPETAVFDLENGGSIAVEDIESPNSIVEVKTKKAAQQRKPRRRQQKAPASPEIPAHASGSPGQLVDSKPWKKYKSLNKDSGDADAAKTTLPADESLAGHDVKDGSEQDSSRELKSLDAQQLPKPRQKKIVDDEPLNLESAMTRRTDWTPPAKKTLIVIDSDGPLSSKNATGSQAAGDDAAEPFGNMMASFKCNELMQPEAGSGAAMEGFKLLRKRKLLELVPMSAAEANETAKPEKSPTRRKGAKKKKARTITAIATAAYRPQMQPDEAAAPLAEDSGAMKPSNATVDGKPKPRKRATKASKKKQPPPPPILLSPETAINQVARQDFVFGTSSQLARDKSPTLPRLSQALAAPSNQLDPAALSTPLNSDALEAPEKRQTLWDAGARDVDGDLFDVEVLGFADPEPAMQDDPFGYVRCDYNNDVASLPQLPDAKEAAQANDSFIDVDVLGKTRQQPVLSGPIQIDTSPAAPPSAQPACATWPRETSSPIEPCRRETSTQQGDAGHDGTPSPPAKTQVPETRTELSTSLERLSDAQLAKQIAQFGFKPVKKRTAMIALLTRCNHGNPLSKHSSVAGAASAACTGPTTVSRAASILAGVGTQGRRPRGRPPKSPKNEKEVKTGASSPSQPVKRPRGRPRKASVDKEEAVEEQQQQPPPSAQPRESPRKRGRPRKDDRASAAAKPASHARAKPVQSCTVAVPSTPKRNPKNSKPTKPIIEIADSDSDTKWSSPSPSPSASATLSPAQAIDLSTTLDEDTQLTLLSSSPTSPTDHQQQASLQAAITKAVTTAPRTQDPAHPSWHEKMLMYDAIVLEELTAWLNGGQLTRVGCDDEVGVGEVKKWCESKGVLCLWEKNLRGKERKRC